MTTAYKQHRQHCSCRGNMIQWHKNWKQAEAQLGEAVGYMDRMHKSLHALDIYAPGGECIFCNDSFTGKRVTAILASLTEEEPGKQCPKCKRDSLERDLSSGRVWCLYAADCGYSTSVGADQPCERVSVCCGTPYPTAKFCPHHHESDMKCLTHDKPWPCKEKV